jgi:hypothetical protein
MSAHFQPNRQKAPETFFQPRFVICIVIIAETLIKYPERQRVRSGLRDRRLPYCG